MTSTGGPRSWRVRDRALPLGRRTLIMGILNVTPDSFSDGGAFLEHDAAVKRGLQLVADGADVIDVGGESTRPGSDDVSAADELVRVLPVIERLTAETNIPVSVDTRKATVAAAALDAGACIVNDVSAAADPAMFGVVRAAHAGLVLMHMLGEPGTMQEDPRYDDVVEDVHAFLRGRVEAATLAGIELERLCVDPGIGFGKTLEHNLALLRNVGRFRDLDAPILVGPSRKRFIAAILGSDEPGARVDGTAGAVAWLAASGADLVRVHDVRQMSRVVRVVNAIVGGEPA